MLFSRFTGWELSAQEIKVLRSSSTAEHENSSLWTPAEVLSPSGATTASLVLWEKLSASDGQPPPVSFQLTRPQSQAVQSCGTQHGQLPLTPDWLLSSSSNLPTFAHLPPRVPHRSDPGLLKSSLSFTSGHILQNRRCSQRRWVSSPFPGEKVQI